MPAERPPTGPGPDEAPLSYAFAGVDIDAGEEAVRLIRPAVESTVRPSLAFYNTCQDIDRLIAALGRIATYSTTF